jgi:hypothetical protein
MDDIEQLPGFLSQLNQEIRSLAASDGLLFEEAATRYLTDLLADVDLASDVVYCTESRQAGNIAYRINAFALSENDENLDLFVVQADDEAGEVPPVLHTADLTRLSRLPEQFLNRGIKGYLKTEIDQHSLAYELATKLHSNDYQPVRVRIFVLTNRLLGARVQGIEERRTDQGVLLQFYVWDLERFYRASTGGYTREPIEINFDDFGGPLPCLPMPVQNDVYQSYLAILPGNILADLYEKYGTRLLEQNVRSFLQFGGKINQGIRDTIREVPHRFLAYNNGLTATASEVETTSLPQGGCMIKSIRSLQIVNGGQTTASIFQTRRTYDASLDQVFVQMKLTVMRHADEMAVMVPLISRFANRQNAVSSADLSANNEFNIELERISRTTLAPAPAGSQVMTRWFFERARGQYKVELARRLTKAGRTAFERENPKNQLLTKESVAKFSLTWDGFPRSAANIGQKPEGCPHIVANGAQKLYEAFTRRREKLPKTEQLPDKTWFQDMVAQAVLFQSAEKLYDNLFGRGGGYRALVVPYALSWLRHLMQDRPFNLTRIWRQHSDPSFKAPIRVSMPLQQAISAALQAASEYLIATSPPRTPREWATREACWIQLLTVPVPAALRKAIDAVPATERATVVSRLRQTPAELEAEEQRAKAAALVSLGATAWEVISQWNQENNLLSERQAQVSTTIPRAIASKRPLTESEVKNGHEVINILVGHTPNLLAELEEAHASTNDATPAGNATLSDVNALLEWDRKQKIKRIWPKAIEQLWAFKKGEQVFNQYWQKRVGLWVDRFREYGFEPDDY